MKQNNEIKGYKKNIFNFILIQLITLIRIPLSIIFSLILLTSKNSNLTLILGISLLLLIEGTDLFDGIIARRYSLVSEYGATLDPYSDSISRLIIYWTLACENLVIFLVPLSMAVRDITVAYCRITLAQNNQSVSAKKSGKIKALVQGIGSFFALLGPVYWNYIGFWSYYALSWIIISVTLLSAIEYVKDALLTIRKNK